MKYFLYAIILMTLIVSCKEKAKDSYLIDGKIKNLNDSTLYIIAKGGSPESLLVDTITCSKEGKFTYQGHSDSLSTVVIYMENGTVWTSIWVQNKDKITLSGDVEYPELIIAKGNGVNNLLAQFKEENTELLEESRMLMDKKANMNHDSLGMEINDTQYVSKISNINHQLKDKAEDFINAHPTSIASLVLLQDYLVDSDDPEKLNEYLSIIHGEATSSSLYKKLVNLNSKLKSTAIGVVAPDFSMINTKNDTISLNTFKGKYLLLSFAASWCEPCEKESRFYVDIRKKYTNNKLGMVTISIDENQSTWKKFATDNKFTWEQIVDTQSWNSSIISLYNISYIPTNYLIDKNSIIIAKDLTPDSLMSLLSEKIE